MNNTISEYLDASPHKVFLHLPCNDFVSRISSSLQDIKLDKQHVRTKALGRQWKDACKRSGKDMIESNSIVYRKIHRLSSANEKQMAKLFNLFEGPYVVIDLYNNIATISSLEDLQQRNEKCNKFEDFPLYPRETGTIVGRFQKDIIKEVVEFRMWEKI